MGVLESSICGVRRALLVNVLNFGFQK